MVHEFYVLHFKEKKKFSYLEFIIQKKNGDTIWVGQSVDNNILNRFLTKIVDGFIATARDITDKKESQELITNQHKSIVKSFKFSLEKIQKGLLPSPLTFSSIYDDYFIISKRQQIVSSDFYWTTKVNGNKIIIVADCSDINIPGSYITLLCNHTLNSIILNERIYSPDSILNELDKRLNALLPDNKGVFEGIEFVVCSINSLKSQVNYAIAGTQFFLFEKNIFTICSGNNKKIGIENPDFNGYQLNTYDYRTDITLFIFTDGFVNQNKASSDGIKFGVKRLIQHFESNISLPLKVQKDLLEKTWSNWTGDQEPTDDVTIISILEKKK